MNPYPCGYFGDRTRECSCSSNQIIAYQKHLSGPLLNRIDIVVPVSRVSNEQLLSKGSLFSLQHTEAQNAVASTRSQQLNRYGSSLKNNSNLSSPEIQRRIHLPEDAQQLLTSATDKLGLSARGYFKVIKVAHTIADLDDSKNIEIRHVSEALQYRQNS